MKRALTALLVLLTGFTLVGCASTELTKGQFTNHMLSKKDELATRAMIYQPCFNLSRDEYVDSMESLYIDCCMEAKHDMPAVLNRSEGIAFGRQIGDCLDVKFYNANKGSMKSLAELRGGDVDICSDYTKLINNFMAAN